MRSQRLTELLEAFRRADSDAERAQRVDAIRQAFAPAPEPDPDVTAVETAARERSGPRAIAMLEAHFGAPGTLWPIADWRDEPEPPPVLWRENRDSDRAAPADAVLSVGELAILAAPGGSGKSYLSLALAVAAANAHKTGTAFGATCGLRIRPGPVVLVSYEDSPVRIAHRLRAMGGIPADIHAWPEPEPLFIAGEARGNTTPAPAWRPLWDAIGRLKPSLVVIDPASAALADVSVSESGPVRTFLAALGREATRTSCGVLIVAHDTKAARNEAAAGGDPGAGAIAGSATWYDGVRGVLYLRRPPTDPTGRLLECLKANYGPTGWTAELQPRRSPTGRFAGFEARPPTATTKANPYA